MSNKFIIENELLLFPINEILKKRLVSKKYKDVIDNSTYLWNSLLKRDYDIDAKDIKLSAKVFYQKMRKNENMIRMKCKVEIDIKYWLKDSSYSKEYTWVTFGDYTDEMVNML